MQTVLETWRKWTIKEWNEALFSHFFSITDGDDTAVSRIVITPEELHRAVRDDTVSPDDLYDAFLSTIRARLKRKRLCADALDLERERPNHHAIPPFFAHLVLTCLVASSSDDEVRGEGNFRKRLNTLLGKDKPNPSYQLGDLPKLWRKLAFWLEEARKRGEEVRVLMLPDPGHMVRIGYAVNLTFPPHRDQLRLIELLAKQGLSDDSPVPMVLEIVRRDISDFSETFQNAFEEFQKVYASRHVDQYQLFRHPFWSAVRDAVRRPPQRQKSGAVSDVARALLRLEDVDAGWFALTLHVDSNCVDNSENGVCAEPTEFPIDGFAHILCVKNDADPQDHAVRLLLDNRLHQVVPGLRIPELFRAVSEGVLLFAPNETGDYIFTASRPEGGGVCALIRKSLADSLFIALSTTGFDQFSFADSIYSGWREVRNLSGAQLASAAVGATLHNIRCLQSVILPPRIRFRGGLQVGSGWLSSRDCLPI